LRYLNERLDDFEDSIDLDITWTVSSFLSVYCLLSTWFLVIKLIVPHGLSFVSNWRDSDDRSSLLGLSVPSSY
jgi:hypothetical protein